MHTEVWGYALRKSIYVIYKIKLIPAHDMPFLLERKIPKYSFSDLGILQPSSKKQTKEVYHFKWNKYVFISSGRIWALK